MSQRQYFPMHYPAPAFVANFISIICEYIYCITSEAGGTFKEKEVLLKMSGRGYHQECRISLAMVSRAGTLGGPSVSRCLGLSISWAGCKDWGEGGITQNYPNITTAQSTGAKRGRDYLEFAKRYAGSSTVHLFCPKKSFVLDLAYDLCRCSFDDTTEFYTMDRKESFVAWRLPSFCEFLCLWEDKNRPLPRAAGSRQRRENFIQLYLSWRHSERPVGM